MQYLDTKNAKVCEVSDHSRQFYTCLKFQFSRKLSNVLVLTFYFRTQNRRQAFLTLGIRTKINYEKNNQINSSDDRMYSQITLRFSVFKTLEKIPYAQKLLFKSFIAPVTEWTIMFFKNQVKIHFRLPLYDGESFDTSFPGFIITISSLIIIFKNLTNFCN